MSNAETATVRIYIVENANSGATAPLLMPAETRIIKTGDGRFPLLLPFLPSPTQRLSS